MLNSVKNDLPKLLGFSHANPITMGVNGLAFKTNSVTYFNKPVNLNNTRRAYASLYAIGNKVMPEENQSLLGRKFGKE